MVSGGALVGHDRKVPAHQGFGDLGRRLGLRPGYLGRPFPFVPPCHHPANPSFHKSNGPR